MSRVIQAVMTADQRTDVVQRLDEVAGVVGVSVLIGASRTPAGDIVSVQVSNDAARAVLKQLDEAGVLSGGSAVLSEPTALIAPAGQEIIDRESNEAAWEEIAALLRRNTNVGTNFLVMMAIAGGIAAVGISGTAIMKSNCGVISENRPLASCANQSQWFLALLTLKSPYGSSGYQNCRAKSMRCVLPQYAFPR